jgi:mono/diheme cytochrome c family protein
MALVVVMADTKPAIPGIGPAKPKPARRGPGAVLFRQHCASCHGVDGKGGGPVAHVLRTTPPDLTAIRSRRNGEFDAWEIASFIDGRKHIPAHGSRTMPIWGLEFGSPTDDRVEREESISGTLLLLVDYLETIQVE